MIAPWLQAIYNQFWQAHQQQRLPHAVLLNGPSGIGKSQLTDHLASALLCQQTTSAGVACGTCSSCRLLAAQTHPDYLKIEAEERGKAIKVEQIRKLCRDLAMTSHAGGYKVAIILDAEAMNINAANSLLKTLEEPTDNTLIMLVTAAPGRLPITIRSRCQKFVCALPAEQVASEWLSQQLGNNDEVQGLLELTRGAPLEALRLHGTAALETHQACIGQLVEIASGSLDPLTVAATWQKEQSEQKLQWFWSALQTMIRVQYAVKPESLAGRLEPLAKQVDNRQVFVLMDRICFSINQWSVGLSTQLLLEDLLISWARLFDKRQASR